MSRLAAGSRRTFIAVAIAVVAIGVPRWSAAQAVSGTIAGTIADQQRQVLPGATLTIINEATGDSRVSVSPGVTRQKRSRLGSPAGASSS